MEEKCIVLLLATFLVSVNGQEIKRLPLKLEGNGYNLMVSLLDNNESPDEIDELIHGLKSLMEEASRQLFMATRQMFYFRNVTILLPSTWQPLKWKQSDISHNEAHIVIENDGERYAYVRDNLDVCGTPADSEGFMKINKILMKGALKSEERKEIFGKIVVHEFGHLRYGIYDEYDFDCIADLKIKEFECEEDNLWTFLLCQMLEHPNGANYASLMDHTLGLKEVTEFCDNDTSNPNTLHNFAAPSIQNEKCDNKSAWQVIREHQDYKDVMNSMEEHIDPIPKITFERRSMRRAVFVFDRSGSMTKCKISLLNQIVKQRLQYTMEGIEYIGVVWFSTYAVLKTKHLYHVNDVLSKNKLDSFIPKVARGSTSIGIGIKAALELLKQHSGKKGGWIYVVTDCKENRPPYIKEILPEVKAYGAVVSFRISIAVGLSDYINGCFELAKATGGYLIAHPNCHLDPEELRLQAQYFSASVDLAMHNEVKDIKKRIHVVKYRVEYTPIKGSVFIEENLGRDTLFEFRPLWWEKANISWIIVSPNGKIYTESSPCYNDAAVVLKTHICLINDHPFQPGMWHYEVMSKESVAVVTLVQSKWTKRGKLPVMMTAFWDKKWLRITDEEKHERQRIVVDLNLGEPLNNPVIHATLIAKITTPKRRVITVYPNDEGTGADNIPNDGIYNAYFYSFDMSGNYDLLVYGKGKNDTVALHRTCSFAKGWYEIAPRDSTGPFTRVNWGGQFHLDLITSSRVHFYAPGKIKDMQIIGASDLRRTIVISWTAVGAQLFNGTASFYDIRLGRSYDSVRKETFREQFRITQDMILEGVNLTSPRSAGETEMLTIKLPSNITSAYIAVIAATRYENKTVYGNHGSIKYFSLNTKKDNGISSPVQSTKPIQPKTTAHDNAISSPVQSTKPIQPKTTAHIDTARPPPLPQETSTPLPIRNTSEPSAPLRNTSDLSPGIIALIVIACAIFTIMLIGSAVLIVKKKKNSGHHEETIDEDAVEKGEKSD